MFCVTFYSYKGGVGRSLALANCAILQARRGKKVLLVDFDLEAPGLTTLSEFKEASDGLGLIDFVQNFISTGVADDPLNYIHSCTILDTSRQEQLVVDVMPAGGGGDEYAGKFASIDWLRLYEEQNGFLLFEELRSSWAVAGYDYVFIDSRTGHTDVGGICTRQLPNLVVAVFFPNEQNLIGLSQVVRSIQQRGARPDPIELIFTASRVPRLDDEHGHLKGILAKFQDVLGYSDDQLVTIEHYDSMMLVNQALFVIDRPNSGLAAQYRKLSQTISQGNIEDPDGALMYANKVAGASRSVRTSDNDPHYAEIDYDIFSRLQGIQEKHERDCIVQYALARAFYKMRDYVSAAISSDFAIQYYGQTGTDREVKDNLFSSIHRLRIRIFGEMSAPSEVEESSIAILHDPNATETMALDAIIALAGVAPNRVPNPQDLPALAAADSKTLMTVARRLAASPSAAIIAANIIDHAIDISQDNAPEIIVNEAQLTLIAGGRFERAFEIGGRKSNSGDFDLTLAFNTAIADWGINKKPDFDRFENMIPYFEKFSSLNDPNIKQCLALAAAVIGDLETMQTSLVEAGELVKAINRREFSCWTYFNVSALEFEQHLKAIANFGEGKGPAPEVFTRAWDGAKG